MGGEVECVEAGCALSGENKGVASKLAKRKKRIRQRQNAKPCDGWVKCSFPFLFISASFINTDDERLCFLPPVFD